MGKTSRKRKIAIVLGLFFAVVLLALIALPLWFPWVLPQVLKNYGVRYSGYERDGYTRFVLRGVEFNRPGTKFEAERVEILFPTTFLWRNFKDDHRENYLRLSGWTLTLENRSRDKPKGTNSLFHVSNKVDAILEQLDRWIPKATLSEGKIRFSDKEISVPSAEWANANLSGKISSDKMFPETFFHADFGRKVGKTVLIENPVWNLGGEITIANGEDQSLKIDGGILWHSNRVEVAAQFGREGWLPDIASLKSASFRIPADIMKLEGYRDLTGSLELHWKTNRFTLDLTGQAQPRRSREIFLSPLTAVVHASGSTNLIRLETAQISSPWLSAKLSKNAEFDFRGKMLSPVASLKVAADLSGQHWINATGQLEGEAILRRGSNRFPDTTFDLSGGFLEFEDVAVDRLDLAGEVHWPWLRINTVKAHFKDGANATANLRFNAVAREVAEGKLRLDGSVGHKFLPPEISYRHILLNAEFSGPIQQLAHSAHVDLQGAKFPGVAPLEIAADWHGRLLDLDDFQANFSAKKSTVTLSGSTEYNTNKVQLRVGKLALQKSGQTILALEKPFAVSCAKTNSAKNDWAIAVEPLRWFGDKTEIRLAGKIQWPEQGSFSVSARELSFSRFRDFFEQQIPEAFIERLNASANWAEGPATFTLDGVGRFFLKGETPFSAEFHGSGNEKGLSIQMAKVGTATESIISGKGFLPLKIVPRGGSNLVEVLPEQRIDFRAETIPNTQFWSQLAAWTQLGFREPRATLLLTGTFDAPEGRLTASAKEIAVKPKDPSQPMPRLQNLLADFDLARQKITLNRAEVFVEGQPVTASGEFPLPKKFPGNGKQVFDWRKADAQLKIVDAQIAPFERLFPKILSPLGTVNLDLSMANGTLHGELRVADAALRPIPSLGPVHDIAASVKFLGDTVKLETFEGNLGGQPVNLSGQINLAKRETNGIPEFHFKLRGTNVPLSRSPDLILRSDIDLAIGKTNGSVPLVSGELNLRDSFYLSDLKLLIPGKVAKPKQRPPYFSVESEPFARWRLDVAVHGTNFLKVRSPLFRGELSANLNLGGTLKEPMALGEMKINSGVVQFPFANLAVDQGFISLTSEYPYRPRLNVAASARTYGYDVKMDVHGFANQPVIEFSSNPGLTSEQILLMVTAGELPRDELNFSTEQKASRLAFFLGKNLISKFGTTGAQDDKLEIRSGENVSEQGRQTYYIEYKLTDEWSIIGEYDRFGGLNAGFKWKFFEK